MHLNKLRTEERKNDSSFKCCCNLHKLCSESTEPDSTVYVDSFANTHTGLSNCFKLLRNLNCDSPLPEHVSYKNDNYTGVDVCESFNVYFCDIYQDEPTPFNDYSDHLFNDLVFETALSATSLRTGPDNIPGSLLRHISSISYHVFKLFQAICFSCVYPDTWKTSRIIPIYKKGDKSNVTSYRPISILSKLSLTFECILFNFLYPLIRQSINHNQFAFMNRRSTITPLILFLDEVYANNDTRGSTYCFYLDFSKSFNKVPHYLLLS